MRKFFAASLIAFCVALISASCGSGDAPFDAAAHRVEVLDWRAERRERLVAPFGYLTLAGLYWLDGGTHSFGSDSSNDVVFPPAAAPVVGEFRVNEAGVSMHVAHGVEVLNDGVGVTSVLISDDTTDTPVAISHATLAWTVVKRDNRFAVRLRDFEHPALKSFGQLPYYDVDPEWRIAARLKRYDQPRTVNVSTVIEGLAWNPISPGVVVFDVGGESFELEAYESGDDLFFVFADATSRDDTYGAGRFLYSDPPGEDGVTVLDFNQAYSPPCAFNDFATCPVASPRNRLAVRVEAGEKFDPSLHHGVDH